MRRLVVIGFGLLALLAGGCGGSAETGSTETRPSEGTATQTPQAPPTPAEKRAAKKKNEEELRELIERGKKIREKNKAKREKKKREQAKQPRTTEASTCGSLPVEKDRLACGNGWLECSIEAPRVVEQYYNSEGPTLDQFAYRWSRENYTQEAQEAAFAGCFGALQAEYEKLHG
jgi:hypothetical protein